MRPSTVLLLALSAALLFAGAGGLGRGEEPPGLYELTARSDLVVSARVVSGSLKLAQVQVLEVFRGPALPGQRLQIAFRDFNMSLGKEDRVVFVDGETELLFLVPEMDWEGRRRGEDRYTLVRGRFGRFTLPREGEDVYLEAVREFSSLVSLKDHRALFDRLKGLVGSSNRVLVDAGMKEVLELDLMDRDMVPRVMGHFRDPASGRRVAALKLMGRLLAGFRDREKHPDFQDATLPPITVLARNDPDERVRVAAVDALGSWGGAAVAETLKEISRQDPSQAVRYQAELILLRGGGGKSGSSSPEKLPSP
jgi:hypothetical protein